MEKRFHHRLLLDHTSEIQSNFDIFNLNTYDTFDFMLFGMSVVLLMLICFVLGWYLHKRCVHQKIFDNIEADIETLRCELSVTHAEHSKKVSNILLNLRNLGSLRSPRSPISNGPFSQSISEIKRTTMMKIAKIKPNLNQYQNSITEFKSNVTKTSLTKEKKFDELQLSIHIENKKEDKNSTTKIDNKNNNVHIPDDNNIETHGNNIVSPDNNIYTPRNNVMTPTNDSVLSPSSNMESVTHIDVQITTENCNDYDNDDNAYSHIVNVGGLGTIRESFNGSLQFDC